ncbi:Alpha/Beta hydrolase protein [Mycena belliarum]|uniref:Alpha/Beta hydrolase protein n=1 Tax=Mycena belliarum TaxID=1033014 RepID=A0AAD6UHY8_9AGAR|nr:Alpha/Beta hydrolase protein [Mycena belliae]
MVYLPWPIAAQPIDVPATPPKPALHHYARPGVAPPSARIDPNVKVQQRAPVRLWHLWKYGLVVVSKATEMTGAVISHNIWGPRRKSWGIEMTLITSFMRGAGRHSALVDIATIRMAMGLSGLIPLPSDALVTPVTFRVRRRKLRGILADLDAAETGNRELSGEWVVGRRTWLRLQAEWKAGQQGRAAAAASEPEKKKERVILYIHGGAYYLSSAAGQRLISIPLSKYTDARVFALDYRLAPETRFPGPLHDAVTAYLRLVEDLHIPSENIIVAGDSAGGGLSLALLMYLRDNEYPLPSAAILMSPWVDLTMSCESWDLNEPYDVVPFPMATSHMNPIALYLGDQVEQYLTHPYASPLFGDFKGLPPLLIQVGDAEVLRDEIALLAHKATLAGVEVRHELYEDAVHIFQVYPFLDSSQRAFMSMHDFARTIRARGALGPRAEEGLELEIDTANATVVRGDGVASEAVKEDLEDEERTESEPEDAEEDDVRPKGTYYPSWGPSRFALASPPTTDDEGDDDDEEDEEDQTPPTPPVETAPTSTLRRIRSAVSILTSSIPDTISAARPALRRHRSHHRTNSHQHLPALTTFMTMSPPPTPSVRRRNSTASHPDITKLVDNWARSGPANETLVYKPLTHPRPP